MIAKTPNANANSYLTYVKLNYNARTQVVVNLSLHNKIHRVTAYF